MMEVRRSRIFQTPILWLASFCQRNTLVLVSGFEYEVITLANRALVWRSAAP